MPTVFITWIAIINTGAFVALWFHVVHGELARWRDMVARAKLQVLVCRKKCVQTDGGGEEEETARAVLLRSEDIYRQSVALYHRALKRPWNYIPGRIMGFCPTDEHET